MTVAMTLAEMTHHSSRGQRMARAGVWGHELNFLAMIQDPPHPSRSSSASTKKSPAGRGQTGSLPLSAPQEWDLRRTVQQIVDAVPPVQILDAPVPQTVEQLPDVLHFFDALMPDPEQVIEVPKILLEDVPMRITVCDTQLVELLVVVPTIVSYSALQRTMEHTIGIPVPDRGGRISGLQRFSSQTEFNSTAWFPGTHF